MFTALAAILSDLAPKLGCLRAAVILHNYILNGVFHAPGLFFDVTPVGRILARLSKDVDVLDSGLPQQITSSLACLFKVYLLSVIFFYEIRKYLFIFKLLIYVLTKSICISTNQNLRDISANTRYIIKSVRS